MTNSQPSHLISPEVEALVREIVSSQAPSRPPESRGPLRLAGGRLDALIGASLGSSLGRRWPSATRAERELAVVHRDELAAVLREACLVRFHHGHATQAFLHRSVTARTRLRVPSAPQWTARAEGLLSVGSTDSPPAGADLLRAILDAGLDDSTSITRLARASQVFAPSDVAECYEGLDLVLTGCRESGVRVLAQLSAGRARRHVASAAEENLGLARGLDGNDAAARTHYRRAWELCPDHPGPIMAWLVCAATTRDSGELRRAARALDDLVGPEHESVTEFIALKRAQMRAGLLAFGADERAFLARTRDAFGPSSERIFDALH